MKRGTFFTLFIFLNLIFIFTKIYQHNLVIQTNYEKQKIEQEKNDIYIEKDKLVMHLLKLKNTSSIQIPNN